MSDRDPKPTYDALPGDLFSQAYPGSKKIMIERDGFLIPTREVELSNDEPPVHIYDTSGPQDCDVRCGLPVL